MLKGLKYLFFFCCINLFCSGAAQIKETVDFLTSEELKGRKSGTIEDRVAQNFLIDKFQTYGLKPLPQLQQFQQEFTRPDYYYFEGEITVSKDGKNYEQLAHKDIRWLSKTKNGTDTLQCVFWGYGLSESESDFDKYKNCAKDKALFVFHSPDFNLPKKEWIQELQNNNSPKLLSTGAKAIISVEPNDKFKSKPQEPFRGEQKYKTDLFFAKTNLKTLENLIGHKITDDYFANIKKQKITPPIPLDIKLAFQNQIFQTEYTSANIIGQKEGKEDRYILIGAHYDHLGIDSKTGSYFPGADDNASGVAIMLELARHFSSIETKHTLIFCAFGAEERNLTGSFYFLENCPIDKTKIDLMINLDVIGGAFQNDTLFFENKHLKSTAAIETWQNSGSNLILENTLLGSSDQIPFYKDSIPSIYFSTGYAARQHTIEDKKEYLDYEMMDKILNELIRFITLTDLSEL